MKKLVFIGMTAIFGLTACASGEQQDSRNMGGNRNTMNSNLMNVGNTSNMNNSTSGAGNMNSNNAANVQDNFWSNAAQGGMAEVELGKLAVQKSQNADVKKFAQMMITDHSKANDELKALAAKKNVTLPTNLGSHQSAVDKLTTLTGKDFDTAYVETMVSDHEKTVELFKKRAEDSSDADLQAFAKKTLPTLEAHLKMIKEIKGKM
jgi:putative membrane protein